MVEVSDSCKMKLSRILKKAIDYLTEYPKRMCGFNSNNGKGVNKLIAPYDIGEASIRHQSVLFGKEPLHSDSHLYSLYIFILS